MTHPLPTLADRFAGLRQELSADAGSPGFGLDAVVLAIILRLLSMLARLAHAWQEGAATAPRFRRHRRGLRPYRRRPRMARRRTTPRTRRTQTRTPPAARPLSRPSTARAPCARPPARASPQSGGQQQISK
jgi:hypothetical protein